LRESRRLHGDALDRTGDFAWKGLKGTAARLETTMTTSRRDCRITRVTTHLVGTRWCNWVFAQVFTDDGITGVGEGTCEWQAKAVEAAIHQLALRHVIGQSAFAIERTWQAMFRNEFARPRRSRGLSQPARHRPLPVRPKAARRRCRLLRLPCQHLLLPHRYAAPPVHRRTPRTEPLLRSDARRRGQRIGHG
jgi:Mandelate racemase / muconate lactonizing enzyme, N-terminal domain